MAEQTLLSATGKNGTFTLPANYFTLGKTIRIKLRGKIEATQGDEIILRAKLKTDTTNYTLITIIHEFEVSIDGYFDLEVEIRCNSLGATGNFITHATFLRETFEEQV
jgi:hypothetical protein